MDTQDDKKDGSYPVRSTSPMRKNNRVSSTRGGFMNRFFVLGLALLILVGSGCATKGYVRKQMAAVSDRLGQVQAQDTALSAKHDTDISNINQAINATDNKMQEAV